MRSFLRSVCCLQPVLQFLGQADMCSNFGVNIDGAARPVLQEFAVFGKVCLTAPLDIRAFPFELCSENSLGSLVV